MFTYSFLLFSLRILIQWCVHLYWFTRRREKKGKNLQYILWPKPPRFLQILLQEGITIFLFVIKWKHVLFAFTQSKISMVFFSFFKIFLLISKKFSITYHEHMKWFYGCAKVNSLFHSLFAEISVDYLT